MPPMLAGTVHHCQQKVSQFEAQAAMFFVARVADCPAHDVILGCAHWCRLVLLLQVSKSVLDSSWVQNVFQVLFF